MPQPEILSRNGSYVAYRQLQEHVGAFRDFLREHGETPEGQELVAAKLMGRWRSGAPLVLAPEQDDPELGADLQRTNDFNYKEMDPHGYAVPLGAHIRRMNPRDTAVNVNRRRIIRRGGPYGPPLPEDAPDDGVERGIAALVGCASLVRQFEFIQNVWINDPNFHELGNEHDPIIGAQDGTFDFTIPEAADQEDDQRSAGVHDRPRRGLLLPARGAGATLARRSQRLRTAARTAEEAQRAWWQVVAYHLTATGKLGMNSVQRIGLLLAN